MGACASGPLLLDQCGEVPGDIFVVQSVEGGYVIAFEGLLLFPHDVVHVRVFRHAIALFMGLDSCTRPGRHSCLPNLQQLHVEDERSVWRDARRDARLAVSQLGGDDQSPLLAYLHGRYTFIPAWDHLAHA